ncbi:hypothetical protein Vafri_12876 [Volvox africanus]|uniref:Uncharacterized protein n=2 Tax=Volvox africanus TaxID=51714 RepID=A0A8J4BAU3_9CHLO|nr:hypothetical protein Vafri_12876 [Volvox africanus]
MDTGMTAADDRMEVSVTGSTGGASSVRNGKGAKSSSTRMVSSKYLQAGVAPPTGHRPDVGREAYHLRAGGSMGYASVSATPAHTVQAGRSLHLPSSLKASAVLTNRNVPVRDSHQHPGVSPRLGSTTLSASSAAAPVPLAIAFDAAAQEKRRELLAKFKQEKAARTTAVPAGQTVNAGSSVAGHPRVPPLPLGIFKEGAQMAGEGSRSSRNGGVYGSSVGGSSSNLSARGGQIQSARLQAPPRPAGAVAASNTSRASGAAANNAKAPPVPRIPAIPPPVVVDQQLRTAVNAPLPRDEVWEAAQAPLPADGLEDGVAGPTLAKTPSSRITKSPRVVVGVGASGTWATAGQGLSLAPQQQGAPAQQSAPVPPRSPPPPCRPQAAAPSFAGSVAADSNSGRLASNAEASTSDTGGRSIRDQIKMAKLQELQWRVLRAKLEVASRARVEKGTRQLAACSLLLTDMMAQSAANSAALAAADALKRTQHVLETQLPLLEQWKELQDTHGPATREVLTALQNAMTSLPLVNGAALGMGGGDISQALPQLRRAIANGVGSLQSAEVAMGLLLQGVNTRSSSSGSMSEARGGQGQAAQGGVIVMATLLPQLYDTLVGEVANLRSLLTNLNTLAAKLDEAACLRARTAAAALAAPMATQELVLGGAWGEAPFGGAADGAAVPKSDSNTVDSSMVMDQALAMLGLGIGAV